MVAVIIEGAYASPIRLEDIFAADRQMGWCLKIYTASARFHAVSGDGLRSLCVYEARDAEAMRRALRTSGQPDPPAVWAATVHPGPGDDPGRSPAMQPGEAVLGMVDRCFGEPVAFEDAQAIEDEKSACLIMHRVRFIRSYFSFDRRKMICIYAAPDLESIRVANRMTGLPCNETWLTKPNYRA